MALNGRSSKSFIDEGAWTKALAEKGDYYLIQFGHNDQKKNIASLYTDAETTFQEYLRRYIKDVRAIGAVPVLVTSLSRRTFKDGKVVEDLKDYAAATRKVGAEEFVTVVDLNAISTAMLNRMTQEEADKLNKTNGGDIEGDARTAVGKTAVDRTHLNPAGQKIFGRMVADAVVRTQVELGPDVIGEPMRAADAAGAASRVQAGGAPAAAQVVWRFDKTRGWVDIATEVLGHPKVVDTPAGKAVQFNGVE